MPAVEHDKRSRRLVWLSAFLLGTMIVLDASVSVAQGWQLVTPMPTARSGHAAATVGDRWYVAGGGFVDGGRSQYPTEVDVYDPASGDWTVLGQILPGRNYIRAIADPAGERVLFVGGLFGGGANGELYKAGSDIAARDGVSLAPGLRVVRYLHAAAFAAGKFVVSGGWPTASMGTPDGVDASDDGASGGLRADVEVWDGCSSSWRAGGTMPAGPRAGHTMTTLQNGREVLVVGGGPSDRALEQVDLFDAASGTWSAAGSLNVARARHQAVLLRDGRVLVAGGLAYPKPNMLQRSAEMFDPTTRQWRLVASMTDARGDFDIVLLPDGRVLVAGGTGNFVDTAVGALSAAEVYDPIADTWTPLPPMHDRRLSPTLAVLSDGVYVAGGVFSSGTGPGSATVLASVERLAWSELGITGPIDRDAGVPDGSGPDATASCGSQDAGTDVDAAPQVDAGLDAPQPRDATAAPTPGDGASAEREPHAGKSGCSCNLGESGRDSLVELLLSALALGVVLRRGGGRRSRRCVRPPTEDTA
jgi:N-acetylneuraminic acid mutarotase